MRLLEHEGKELLRQVGIRTPPGIVTNNKSYVNLSYHKQRYADFFFEHGSVAIKAQVPVNSRKKKGLISVSDDYEESLRRIDALYAMTADESMPVDTLLIEKRLQVKHEYFLAIVYDTEQRAPAILLSRRGGVDVEENGETPSRLSVDPVIGLHPYQSRALAKQAGFTGRMQLAIAHVVSAAYDCFTRFDCRSLEINPLIETGSGMLYAGDAKIEIDDSGLARQEHFSERTANENAALLTPLALQARAIDLQDHRGVAGKTFLELDGDIAVLASGGGASLLSMDALLAAGGKPANYTEYSGNPPREKVRQLTRIALSKAGLRGALVIGGRANFTDVHETLSGFLDGVLETIPLPGYPIVVRRAGPRDAEAYALLSQAAKKHGLDITLLGEEISLSEAAAIMAQKAEGHTQ